MQRPRRILNLPHYYPKPVVQSKEHLKKVKDEEILVKSDNHEVENIDVKK